MSNGVAGASERLGGVASQVLQDRLDLLALELREAKIRFIQALIIACIGVAFFLLGLVLSVLVSLYILPIPFRLYGLVAAAVLCLLAGSTGFILLVRRLKQKPLAFDQSLAELKKDAACF